MKSSKMKKMKKRILAMLLCTTMMLNTGVSALADEVVSDAHVHTETCYEKHNTGNLICTKAEVAEAEAHVHADECYEMTSTQELTCTLAETEGHSHGDGCVETKDVLICGKDEHTHDDGCYKEETIDVCTDDSEEHTCGDGCVKTTKVLDCDAEHAHDGGCYTTETNIVCGQEEVTAHAHGEGCYTTVENKTQICTLEEVEAHTHGDECYEWEENLVCTISEVAPMQIDETEKSTEENVQTEVEEETEFEDIVEKEIQTFTWEQDGVTVEVTEKVIGAIPKGSTLSVTPIVEGDEYKEVEEQLQAKAENEEYDIAGFLAYDICFVDAEGNEIEPNDNVNVSILYDEAVIPEMNLEEDAELDVTVMHFEEDKNGEVAQIVDMVAEDDIEANVTTTDAAEVEKVEFVTDAFSAFTIIWISEPNTKQFTVNTWTNNTWQRLDTDLDNESYTINTGETINLLTDSRFVATAKGTTYKVAFGILQNSFGEDVGARITTIKVARKGGTWQYECGLTDGSTVTYTNSSITGLKLFYNVDSSDSGDYDTGDTYTVYVYVGSYTNTSKTEVISDECLELLGIDKSTIDGNGYFPVGEIQIAKSLINSKGNAANIGGQPLITSEEDWQAVLAALGELDTTTLIDELGVSYTKNINNKVGEYIDQASKDIGYTWGTMRTALFRWNDTEHYGFAGSNTGIKYHLDLRFNTNKITFITGNNGINNGVAKDGTTVDSRTYITGSEIQEPRNLKIPDGYKFAGYFEDANFTKEWNGIGTPLNEDQTVYIRIVEEDHVVLFYKVAQGEGSVSRDMDDFNPTTGVPQGSVATPDTNYIFEGWYLDEACTNLISDNVQYIPTKPEAGWESIDGTTYWAKFVSVTTTYAVEKVWEDNNDSLSLRPSEIQVQLYVGNEPVEGKVATLYADNGWKYTFTDLPIREGYTAKEVAVPGYTSTYNTDDSSKTVITNTLNEMSVGKVWVDYNNVYNTRPETLKTTLTYVDEQDVATTADFYLKSVSAEVTTPEITEIIVGGKTVKVVHSNWGATLYGLPDGSYTFSEEDVSGYTSSGPEDEDGVVTFTNILNEMSVEKVWLDYNNAYNTRPETLKTTLTYVDDQNVATTADFYLKSVSAEITTPEITEFIVGEKTVKVVHSNWGAILYGLPDEYIYTFSEEDVPGYISSEPEDKDGVVTFTNTLNEITIQKVWNDADNFYGKRPTDGLDVTVLTKEDGVQDEEIVITLNDGNTTKTGFIIKGVPITIIQTDWSATIYGMPSGYTYEFTEEVVQGYTGSKALDESGNVIFTNKLNVLIVKKDQAGNVLSGAVFRLTDGTNTYEITSDTNGVLNVPEGISDGIYTLTEIEAPAKYMLSTEEWTVTVNNGVISSVGTLDASELTYDSSLNAYTAIFVNELLYSLPSTGGHGIYTTMLSGFALMLGAAYVWFSNRREEVL